MKVRRVRRLFGRLNFDYETASLVVRFKWVQLDLGLLAISCHADWQCQRVLRRSVTDLLLLAVTEDFQNHLCGLREVPNSVSSLMIESAIREGRKGGRCFLAATLRPIADSPFRILSVPEVVGAAMALSGFYD